MDKLGFYAPLVARILMGALFVIAALGKLSDVAGFAGYMASGGVPAILAWPSIIFELVLGAALIVGYQARIMALLGAACRNDKDREIRASLFPTEPVMPPHCSVKARLAVRARAYAWH